MSPTRSVPLGQVNLVHHQAGHRPARVDHLGLGLPAVPEDAAGVAHLAAGLAVERRAIREQLALVAGVELGDLAPVLHQRDHRALTLVAVALVAEELGLPEARLERRPEVRHRLLA